MSVQVRGKTATVPELTPHWISQALKTEAVRIRCKAIKCMFLEASRYRNGGSWISTRSGNGSRVVLGHYPAMSVDEAVALQGQTKAAELSEIQTLLRRAW